MKGPLEVTITRVLIEKKLSQLLLDDETGWEAAATEIAAKINNSEGIEITSYDSPSSFHLR